MHDLNIRAFMERSDMYFKLKARQYRAFSFLTESGNGCGE